MAARRDFIKSNDAEFANQVLTFTNVAGAAPPVYGLTAGQLAALSGALDSFQSTILDHQAKTDAAKASTEAKSDSRAALEALFRQLNNQIQANPTVTDGERAAAGLPVRDTSRTPVPPPATAPTVLVETGERLVHRVRLMDPSRPKGGKPEGVAYYGLYYKLGPTPPASVAECTPAGNHSRTRVEVTFDPADGGKTAWYLAIPFNAKGQPGPVSDGVSATIAA